MPRSGGSQYPMTGDLWLNNGKYIYSSTSSGGQASIVGMSGNNNIFLGENDVYFNIYIYGDNVYHNNGSNHLISSDVRIKNSIGDINNAREFILSLKPRAYKLNSGKSNRYHLGFIADELEDTMLKTIGDCGVFAKFPVDADTIIDLNDENTYIKGIRYGELIAPTIAVVQELAAENEELRRRIDRLENLYLKKLLEERQ